MVDVDKDDFIISDMWSVVVWKFSGLYFRINFMKDREFVEEGEFDWLLVIVNEML